MLQGCGDSDNPNLENSVLSVGISASATLLACAVGIIIHDAGTKASRQQMTGLGVTIVTIFLHRQP